MLAVRPSAAHEHRACSDPTVGLREKKCSSSDREAASIAMIVKGDPAYGSSGNRKPTPKAEKEIKYPRTGEQSDILGSCAAERNRNLKISASRELGFRVS